MTARILIADDEELERRALKFIISGIDCHEIAVVEAANGRQAVEEARLSFVDLALLDVRMPGMDGIAAARELRAISPRTKVVFVTAFDSFDYAREALRLGVDEYLLKPADRETVRATVLRVLDKALRERSDQEVREKTGKEREQAVTLLEKELRGALERNALSSERFESFLDLRGVRCPDRFIAVARALPGSRGEEKSIRRSRSRHLAGIAETMLRDSGWFGLAAADGEETRIIAVAEPDRRMDRAQTLERLVAAARDGLGQRILVGAVPWFSADGPELFSPAMDALALAHQNNPVIFLTPARDETVEGPGVRRDRGAFIVTNALEFIRAHLSEDLSLSDVAAHAGCSSFYLSHLFRLYSGDTFIRVIMRLRLDSAKALLRTGKYSVKEVASLVGFHDQTYFARIFKRLENCSPAEFRARPPLGPSDPVP